MVLRQLLLKTKGFGGIIVTWRGSKWNVTCGCSPFHYSPNYRIFDPFSKWSHLKWQFNIKFQKNRLGDIFFPKQNKLNNICELLEATRYHLRDLRTIFNFFPSLCRRVCQKCKFYKLNKAASLKYFSAFSKDYCSQTILCFSRHHLRSERLDSRL